MKHDDDRLSAFVNSAAQYLGDCDVSGIVREDVDEAIAAASLVDRLLWGSVGPTPRGILSSPGTAKDRRQRAFEASLNAACEARWRHR